MSFNWFERGVPATPAADTPIDYVAWAKRAYEHIRQQPVSYTHLTLPTTPYV